MSKGVRNHKPLELHRRGSSRYHGDPKCRKQGAVRFCGLYRAVLPAPVPVSQLPESSGKPILKNPGKLRLPPVTCDMRSSAFSSSWRHASLTAATIRSCNISISSGSTTSGLISSSWIWCPAPITTRTTPPANRCFRCHFSDFFLSLREVLLHFLRLTHQLIHLIPAWHTASWKSAPSSSSHKKPFQAVKHRLLSYFSDNIKNLLRINCICNCRYRLYRHLLLV